MPLKTKAAYRTIILPPQLVEVLKEFRKRVYSKWLFPSPYKSEDVPRNPNSCRQRLSIMLERANCKYVPFHALRHTFATQALRYGMPIKTLACIIGHESVETTLDVYSHITDEGMKNAAKTIDRTMGALASDYTDENEDEVQIPKPTKRTKFEANKGKTRRPGTGSIKKVAINTWQGRYAPTVNGKRIIRHIYANSIEECEQKLAELIAQMKEEYKLV